MGKEKSPLKVLDLDPETKYKILIWPVVVFLILFVSFIYISSNLGALVFLAGNKQRILSYDTSYTSKSGTSGSGKACDLYNGTWVRDFGGTIYTNTTCKTLPDSKNCEKYGKDHDFVKWRWSPHGCDLARFDPELFLRVVKGKQLAFVGDSVGRNQMELLLCLLSEVEIPLNIYQDPEDRNTKWHFVSYNFTLICLWTKFLVQAEERTINGSLTSKFDLHLDQIDPNWSNELPHINYIILSSGHWFFRQNYLYDQNKLIGCVYCASEKNITNLSVAFSVKQAFRAALKFLKNLTGTDLQLVLVRTFSPSHFENGTWNKGGSCSRTSPNLNMDLLSGIHFEISKVQMEEIGMIENGGKVEFRAMEVTKLMEMRPDGHPGSHFDRKWVQGYSDCVHWCLPGPIDTWNQLLLETLRQ